MRSLIRKHVETTAIRSDHVVMAHTPSGMVLAAANPLDPDKDHAIETAIRLIEQHTWQTRQERGLKITQFQAKETPSGVPLWEEVKEEEKFIGVDFAVNTVCQQVYAIVGIMPRGIDVTTIGAKWINYDLDKNRDFFRVDGKIIEFFGKSGVSSRQSCTENGIREVVKFASPHLEKLKVEPTVSADGPQQEVKQDSKTTPNIWDVVAEVKAECGLDPDRVGCFLLGDPANPKTAVYESFNVTELTGRDSGYFSFECSKFRFRHYKISTSQVVEDAKVYALGKK